MDTNTDALEELGMTKAQIKVYLAALEVGESKTGEIIKKSGLQSSVVYYSLTQLISMGLMTFIIKGKIKYFSATDPENLIKFVDDKKKKIERLVPHLRKKASALKQEAQVFSGWKGIYYAFNKILDILPKGEEYIAWGAGFEDQYTEEAKKFFREYQKKRAEKKYKIKIIVNEDFRKQVERYEWYPKFGKPEYKYVPGFAPVGVIVFGDNVLNVAFEETPIAVLTTSKAIANSYRNSFYSTWKIAKK